MPDLPPDLPRLRTLETYLRLQLAEVHAAIEAATPAPGYVIQHVPTPVGGEGRGVLHRESCTVLEGVAGVHQVPFAERAARIALEDPAEINSACETCRPDVVLRPVKRAR